TTCSRTPAGAPTPATPATASTASAARRRAVGSARPATPARRPAAAPRARGPATAPGSAGPSSRSLRRRQVHAEDAPLADLALHGDRAPHRLDQVLDDREPEPGASALPGAPGVHPVQALEDPRQVLGLDPGAVVDDLEQDPAAPPLAGDPDRPVLLAVLDGVVDEVLDHLLDPHRVAERDHLLA